MQGVSILILLSVLVCNENKLDLIDIVSTNLGCPVLSKKKKGKKN